MRGCDFGVMLWSLELFAFRFDGEAPQKHVHYIEHRSGGAVCGPFSTSPLSAQPEYHYRHVGPFGWAVCTPVSKYIFWGLRWPLTLGPPAEMNSRCPPHVLVKDFSKNLVAEILGIVWLNLKGGVSFVSVPFLFARIGAIWWPLCLSKRCFSKGAMAFVGPIPSAFQASRSEKEDALGGSCFNVFEAVGVTFWSISGSCWEVLATFGHLPTHLAPESRKYRTMCKQ